MRISITLVFISFFALDADAGRILAGYPVDALSHLHSIAAYLRRLASEHEVVILQVGVSKEVDLKHPNISNIMINLNTHLNLVELVNSFLWISSSHGVEPPMVMFQQDQPFHQLIDESSDALAKIFAQKWDLVVIEQLFNPITYGVASFLNRYHGVPYVQYSSSHMLESDAVAYGMGRSWASKMSLFIPVPRDSDDVYKASHFWERTINFFEHFGDYFLHSFAHYWTFSAINRLGVKPFSMKTLRSDSSAYFSDYFWGFEPAAEAYDFRVCGAYCTSPRPLNTEFEDFVGDPKSKGTILLALGSMVRWPKAPQNIADAVFGALNELTDYRVVVASKGKPNYELASHVRVIPWVPQIDLLGDNRTKVFISHGGLKSVKEAVCGKTPVLYIPLFAEQSHNARLLMKKGVATIANKYTMTKQSILNELHKMLDNPGYQQRMDKIRSYFLDHPVSNLDMASHLTNRIIRKRGQNLWFKLKGAENGWPEYLYIPQLSALLILIVLISQ